MPTNNHIRRIQGFPVLGCKQASFAARGLMDPIAWEAVNRVARAPRATVVRQTSARVQISFDQVVVIAVIDKFTGAAVVLTAWSTRTQGWARPCFLNAAKRVVGQVDLADRVRDAR